MVDHTVVHFEIPADDVEKISKFYEDLFGWRIQHVGWMDYWTVETVPTDDEGNPVRPGVNGGLMRRESPGQRPTNYISVESAREYAAKIEELGGTVIMPPEEIPNVGWVAVAADPEGNYFGMIESAR
jgi:predicted enzyme related to lactoylglutathione lyase